MTTYGYCYPYRLWAWVCMQVRASIEIIARPDMFALAKCHITVSTVGVVQTANHTVAGILGL